MLSLHSRSAVHSDLRPRPRARQKGQARTPASGHQKSAAANMSLFDAQFAHFCCRCARLQCYSSFDPQIIGRVMTFSKPGEPFDVLSECAQSNHTAKSITSAIAESFWCCCGSQAVDEASLTCRRCRESCFVGRKHFWRGVGWRDRAVAAT